MQAPLINQKTQIASHERASKRSPLPSEQFIPRYLPSVLGRRDMFFMYTCALFLLTNAVLGASGGVVSLTYLILGALLFFIPTIVASAQLGILLPHEGSLYNWTYHALGYYWSFFVGLIYWVTGILALITGADAFVTIIQGLNNAWLTEPWQQGLTILLIVLVGTLICLQRLRTTQNIINSIMVATLFCVVLIALAIVAPYFFPFAGNATNTLVIIYNILSASLTLVWTAATFFFFINLIFVYRNNPQRFRVNRILPMSIIWIVTGVGGLACLFTIIAILVYS